MKYNIEKRHVLTVPLKLNMHIETNCYKTYHPRRGKANGEYVYACEASEGSYIMFRFPDTIFWIV